MIITEAPALGGGSRRDRPTTTMETVADIAASSLSYYCLLIH